MHKGYTLNYFIKFFENIPNSKFTTGELLDSDGKMCALGHAGRADLNKDLLGSMSANPCCLPTSTRADALNDFLNHSTTDINDATPNDKYYGSLGKTPRARILKALRNRKRYGHILGRNGE